MKNQKTTDQAQQGEDSLPLKSFVHSLSLASNEPDHGFSTFIRLLQKELPVYDKNGNGVCLNRPICDDDGNVIGFEGLIENCKAAKKIRDDAASSEEEKDWIDFLAEEERTYVIYRNSAAQICYELKGESFPWVSSTGEHVSLPVADFYQPPPEDRKKPSWCIPPTSRGYEIALAQDAWTSREAFCWLQGCDPRYYRGDIEKEPDYTERMIPAINSGKLTHKGSSPNNWIAWWKSKGFTVPEELKDLSWLCKPELAERLICDLEAKELERYRHEQSTDNLCADFLSCFRRFLKSKAKKSNHGEEKRAWLDLAEKVGDLSEEQKGLDALLGVEDYLKPEKQRHQGKGDDKRRHMAEYAQKVMARIAKNYKGEDALLNAWRSGRQERDNLSLIRYLDAKPIFQGRFPNITPKETAILVGNGALQCVAGARGAIIPRAANGARVGILATTCYGDPVKGDDLIINTMLTSLYFSKHELQSANPERWLTYEQLTKQCEKIDVSESELTATVLNYIGDGDIYNLMKSGYFIFDIEDPIVRSTNEREHVSDHDKIKTALYRAGWVQETFPKIDLSGWEVRENQPEGGMAKERAAPEGSVSKAAEAKPLVAGGEQGGAAEAQAQYEGGGAGGKLAVEMDKGKPKKNLRGPEDFTLAMEKRSKEINQDVFAEIWISLVERSPAGFEIELGKDGKPKLDKDGCPVFVEKGNPRKRISRKQAESRWIQRMKKKNPLAPGAS